MVFSYPPHDALDQRLEHYQRCYPGVFFTQKKDFSFSSISSNFAKLFGHNVKDGQSFLNTIHEEDRQKFIREIEQCRQPEQRIELFYRTRHPQSGNIVYVHDIRTARLTDDGQLEYDGVLIDNTRQATAELRLAHATWKESLATLTASLVHDFSNVIAGIYSLSELYYAQLPECHHMREGMEQIQKSSKEAQKLIRRLVDLNREKASKKAYHNLRTLIDDQMDLMKAILPKNTHIEVISDQNEYPVHLDDVAFRQAFLNFAVNSRDALQEARKDGKINVTLRHVNAGDKLAEGALRGNTLAAKEGVEMQFSDNGVGIKPQHLEKIFTPFFTTKEVSKGSGFGLYNVHRFAEENGGTLKFYSKPQQGTTFFLYLPFATFQETIEVSCEMSHAKRGSFLIYAASDPGNLETTQLFQEKEWEVATFSDAEQIKHCVSDTYLLQPTVFLVDLGQDPAIPQLVDYFKTQHPKLKILLQVHGRNPDQIASNIVQSVDVFLDASVPPNECVRRVESIL